MGDVWITFLVLVAVAFLAWVVANVFRAGAPTGESSSRADTFASGAGYGAEDLDTLRNNQRNKDS